MDPSDAGTFGTSRRRRLVEFAGYYGLAGKRLNLRVRIFN